MAKLPTRIRAEDLWTTGEAVTLTDGNRSVEVWVQALNEPEEDIAHARANAARARVLVASRDPQSMLVMRVTGEVMSLSDEFLVEYLTGWEVQRHRDEATAQVEAEEEWTKDGYLDGLQDAWDPPPGRDGTKAQGLKDQWAVDHDHPEAKRVWDELQRFLSQVAERVEPIEEALRAEHGRLGRAELERKAVAQFLEAEARRAWSEEFRWCLVWLGTREPTNHLEYYWLQRETIDRLPDPVREQVREVALRVNVDVMTGKGSRPRRASSNSSAPPAGSGTDRSSGPAAASG